MAVVPLNLSALNMETLPEAYEKIVEAICERKTILNSYDIDQSWNNDISRYTNSYGFLSKHQPNFAMCMNALATCVFRMGWFFADLSGNYIQDSYSNFPKSLRERMIADTEHSLGASIMTFDSFDEHTIEDWKTVLKNAAYWLNQCTAIKPLNCSTVQKCNQTNHWTNTPNWGTGDVTYTSEETGSSYDMHFDVRYYSWEYDHSTQSGADHSYSGDAYIKGRCGLAIDNKTPFPADVLLYLCLPHQDEAYWEIENKWQTYGWSMEIQDNLWTPDPNHPEEKWTGKTTTTNRHLVYAGGQWRPSYEIDQEENWSAGSGGGQDNYLLGGTVSTKRTNYSHDGNLSYVMRESENIIPEDPQTRSYGYASNELEMYRDCYLWDGFGIWNSPSEPLSAEVLPARTKKIIDATVFNTLPMPQHYPSEFVPDGWTRGSMWWDETLDVHFRCFVVPILDFKDSLTTFEIEDESSEQGDAPIIGG